MIKLNNELVAIKVTGEDASKYLQGQLTNDINQATNDKWQLSAHLNPKGRIIANFIITKQDDNQFILLTPKNIESIIIPRLKMFILRSKVKLEVLATNIYLSEDKGISLTDKFILLSDDIFESQENSNDWKTFLVENNLPFIYQESSEEIIPQQISYDLMGGVNFKKGCYTGQEIVARTHYLGKVKRRLCSFVSNTPPLCGQTIISSILDGQEVGFVVDFYQNQDKYIGLASIQLDCIDDVALLGVDEQKLLAVEIKFTAV